MCKICVSRVIVLIELIEYLAVLFFEVLLNCQLKELRVSEELSSLLKFGNCLDCCLTNGVRVFCEQCCIFWNKTVGRLFGCANNYLNLPAAYSVLLWRFQQRRRLLNWLRQDFRTNTGFNFDFDLNDRLVCWVKCRLMNFAALWFKYIDRFAFLRRNPVEEWASIAVCINLAICLTFKLLSDDLPGSWVGNTYE